MSSSKKRGKSKLAVTRKSVESGSKTAAKKPSKGKTAESKTKSKQKSGGKGATLRAPVGRVGFDEPSEALESFAFSFGTKRVGGIDTREVTEGEETQAPDEAVLDLARGFTTRLELLWAYIVGVGSVSQMTTFENIVSIPFLMNQLIERERAASALDKPKFEFTFKVESKYKSGRTHETSVGAKVYERVHADKIDQIQKYHNAALNILHETAIQQIYNCYEVLIGDLMNWYFMNNPLAVSKEQTIAYQEILLLSSFDDAKRFVVNKAIEDFLKNKTLDEQLSFINKEFGADIPSLFCELSSFKEFVLRRHAVVHAGGLATGEYVRRVSVLGMKEFCLVKVGDRLEIGPAYIRKAWRLTYMLGVILVHQVVRKYCQRKKLLPGEENADHFLNNSAYSCIKNNQLETAEGILRYGKGLHFKRDVPRLMLAVNLAQTLYWKGEHAECELILGEYDWKAASSSFRLCVAAIKEDRETFQKELASAHSEGTIDIFDLYEWPVFRKMRRDKDFPAWVQRVFGAEAAKDQEDVDFSLLNVGRGEALQRIEKKLKNLRKTKRRLK